MTQSPKKFRSALIFLSLLAFLSLLPGKVYAQKQSETAESLGLGGASRFDAGYSAIVIDRTSIVPGVPFNVKPTMDNLVNTSKTSMGGILNRFDTSKFGQMFKAGASPAAAAAASRITKTAPPAANVPLTPGKLYPPQLEIDYKTHPQSDVTSPEIKKRINRHLNEVLSRYPLSDSNEQVVLVFEGRRLILRGEIHSSYTAELLVLTMQMEPGIDEVVNELIAPDTEEKTEDFELKLE